MSITLFCMAATGFASRPAFLNTAETAPAPSTDTCPREAQMRKGGDSPAPSPQDDGDRA